MIQTDEGENYGLELKRVAVMPYNMITQISMKQSDKCLSGLKFGTDEFDFCLDLTWNTGKDGSWKDVDVPEGQVICGVAANTNSQQNHIMSLGFLMATEENQQ